jgi:protein-S-isoprenylcysteine O-methyltransferase Ste14
MSSLATRAAAQTAGLLILFALIFVSAGTIHFWQGWLFCLSFSFSTIAIGVYLMKRDPALLERRMRFGPGAESRPIQKIIMTITLVTFVVLAIVPALDHRFGWSRVPAAIVVIANILIVAAFGLFLLVFRENTFAASTISVEARQRVISTGPYAHVRHPIYAGAALLIFAMPIALGSLWGPARLCDLDTCPDCAKSWTKSALSAELPGYGFERHKGYGTAGHIQALGRPGSAAPSLLIRAGMDGRRRAAAARALGWPTVKGEKWLRD